MQRYARVRLMVFALLAGCATRAAHPVPSCGTGWTPLTVTHAPDAHVALETKTNETIERVEVAGVDANLATNLRRELATKPGMTVIDAPIGDDIRRLWKLGVASDVAVEQQAGTVLFVVSPQPIIHTVVRKGGDKLAQARFRQLEATTYEPARVQRMTEALRESYVRDGRLDARVEARHRTHTPTAGSQANVVDVCVELDPGPRVTIGKVEFPGRKAVPEKALLKAMRSKTINHVGGMYNEEAMQLDQLLIQVEYWDRGFADMHVGEPKLSRSGKHLVLSIPITEGPIYRLGKITLDVPARLPIKTGDTFSRSQIIKTLDAIRAYNAAIYDVIPRTTANKDARTMDIEFELEWRWQWDAVRAWLSHAH